jgi:hypothetical protein
MRLFLLLISIAAFGQPAKFEPPRQSNGHPDLEGVWRNASIVAAPAEPRHVVKAISREQNKGFPERSKNQ